MRIQNVSRPARIKTRFLILSDTHSQSLFPSSDNAHAYREPLPAADVVLHCGDLTYQGRLTEYPGVFKMLRSINAELKLVIAGNHDRTLDGEYWSRKRPPRCNAQDHARAMEMWTGDEARAAGVIYLQEGIHEFTLKSGARLRVYATPYQPEFCGWAFAYEHDEDRFNPKHQVARGAKSIVENVVPDFPNVDVMMTHGPPQGHMDVVVRDNSSVGCPHLYRALTRARPLLHCFGHIHEGHGAEILHWRRDAATGGSSEVEHVQPMRPMTDSNRVEVGSIDVSSGSRDGNVIVHGEQTLLVNAAIMTVRGGPDNAPWLVDLDLMDARTVDFADSPSL